MQSCFSIKRYRPARTFMTRSGAAVIALSLGASSFGQCEIDELFPRDGQQDDKVGWDSAISGNVAILGAPWDDNKGPDSGAAYFYRYDPNVDQWLADAKILETDGTPHNEFGLSVGVDGKRAIIASPYFQATLHGVVYIYEYDQANKAWTEEAALTASDGVAFDEFGTSIAIDGDVIIVGAPRSTVNTGGRAYVFRYDPKQANWIEEAILLSSAPINGDNFGYSVDIDGEVAIVASPGGALAALVFRRDPLSGDWVEEANLTDKNFAAGSVAVFEGTALVGHPGDGANGGIVSGAAFVYRFDLLRGTWELEQELFPSDGQDGDYFGASLAVDGDGVVVGAPQWTNQRVGAVYTYRYAPDQNLWIEQAKLQPADGAEGDFFGRSVAISDGIALVGATGDNANGSGSGSGYLFDFQASPADLDCNGTVGASDVLALLASWGTCSDCDPPAACPADLDGDCIVGASDLIILLGDWG